MLRMCAISLVRKRVNRLQLHHIWVETGMGNFRVRTRQLLACAWQLLVQCLLEVMKAASYKPSNFVGKFKTLEPPAMCIYKQCSARFSCPDNFVYSGSWSCPMTNVMDYQGPTVVDESNFLWLYIFNCRWIHSNGRESRTSWLGRWWDSHFIV